MAINVKSYTGGIVAAQVIANGPVTLSGLTVNVPVLAAVSTLTVWNNASAASGTILFQKTFPISATPTAYTANFHTSVKATVGITVTVATTALGDISFWLN